MAFTSSSTRSSSTGFRARGRRPATGRLRRDGPIGHCEAPVQGGLSRAACCRHRHRRRTRDPRICLRPGGVYLDLPAKLFAQVIDAEAGAKSLVKVVEPAPAQLPAPAAVKRALDVLKSAKRPLIILGKGAAYAQADDAIRALVETSGIPFLQMSMAKGLLPDTHPLSAGAARSTVLKDSDVVMMIGARLNWLLSHGKGKTWGESGSKKFVQIDIEPKEMDSNVGIVAPVVGDIGSCVAALLEAMDSKWPAAPADWTGAINTKREENVSKMASRLMKNAAPMDFHSALGALRTVIKERPDAILVNEGANTLDLARG